VAIIPNSVIAKSKLGECSTPTKITGQHPHQTGALADPRRGLQLLKEVLRQHAHSADT